VYAYRKNQKCPILSKDSMKKTKNARQLSDGSDIYCIYCISSSRATVFATVFSMEFVLEAYQDAICRFWLAESLMMIFSALPKQGL